MRNHLLGFPDNLGKGPCTLLFGTEHGVTNNVAELARIRSGDWPDGIVRVELHNDDSGLEQVAINTNSQSQKRTKTMKFKHSLNGLIVASAALFGIATSSFAQSEPVYYPFTVWYWQSQVGITNNTGMNISSVTNYYATNSGGPAVIDCRKQSKVPIQITFNSNTNIANTNGCAWVKSVDGEKYDTNDVVLTYVKWTPAAAGGQFNLVTNIDCSDCGYIKLLFWTNDTIGAGGVIQTTNITIKAGIKIP